MRIWAAELTARSPDVVVTFSNFALDTLKPIAGGVPIVLCGVGNPVGSDFVASLARPGGNMTVSPATSRRWAASGSICSRRSRPMSGALSGRIGEADADHSRNKR
jgi:hypothetical protein